MGFFCVAGWFGVLFFLGKAAHCREKINIIAYLIGHEEIFDPVMARLSPLRKIHSSSHRKVISAHPFRFHLYESTRETVPGQRSPFLSCIL